MTNSGPKSLTRSARGAGTAKAQQTLRTGGKAARLDLLPGNLSKRPTLNQITEKKLLYWNAAAQQSQARRRPNGRQRMKCAQTLTARTVCKDEGNSKPDQPQKQAWDKASAAHRQGANRRPKASGIEAAWPRPEGAWGSARRARRRYAGTSFPVLSITETCCDMWRSGDVLLCRRTAFAIQDVGFRT